MSEDKSVIDRHSDELTKLTTTDQLDVKWILLRQFTVISDLMRSEVYNPDAVNQAILMLWNMIPKSLYDDEFINDVEASHTIVVVDDRLIWCGVRVGPPKFHEEKTIKPFKLLNSITNLFDRKGLWLRKTPKTVFRGKRYGS